MVISSVERDEPPNHMKQLEDVQNFTWNLQCQYCHEWWLWEIENESNNNWIGKSHFLFESWSKEIPFEECSQFVGGNCWCIVQYGQVGGFGMGYRNILWFIFEWRSNTNSQASSSMWVCPTTKKICNGAFFGVFSCRCDEHAIYYG